MSSNQQAFVIQTVGIAGSGTMGAGIAQVVAQAGYGVLLYDIQQDFLDKAISKIQTGLKKAVEKGKLSEVDAVRAQKLIQTTTKLKDFKTCELVIEAIPEVLELKHKLFAELDKLLPASTIIASNTSSISVTQMASACSKDRRERFAGLHFFNPVPVMKLVEVIRGFQTESETIEALKSFSTALGKTPVVVKDTPGFIVNRVARPFYGEALKTLNDHGGLDNPDLIRTIDRVMTECGGFKMGPFALMDMIGIDINFTVTQSVYNAYFQEARYKPSILQQTLVNAQCYGQKSGKGFYDYPSTP